MRPPLHPFKIAAALVTFLGARALQAQSQAQAKDKTRQDEQGRRRGQGRRQDEDKTRTGQDKPSQAKTRQDKAEQGKTSLDDTRRLAAPQHGAKEPSGRKKTEKAHRPGGPLTRARLAVPERRLLRGFLKQSAVGDFRFCWSSTFCSHRYCPESALP